MTSYSKAALSIFLCLNFLKYGSVCVSARETLSMSEQSLRKKPSNRQAKEQNDIDEFDARMFDPLDADFDWDSREPIPVGKMEESHEEGRMLFNLPVGEAIIQDGDVLNEVKRNKSKHGGHYRGSNTDADVSMPDESEVQGYIINGKASGHRSWFGLTMEEINGEYYRGPCGATLVNRQWAVTAAHCFSNMRKNDLTHRIDYLYVGAYQPWTPDQNGKGNAGRPYEIIKIVEKIEHWSHKPGAGSSNDIALIKLEKPVSDSFQDFQPMALATSDFSTSDVGEVYGFGDTSFGGGNSQFLRMTSVRYVTWNNCRQAMSRWGITNDMICFGGNGRDDACSGDSGGPIIVNNQLGGVVSWGYRCASNGYPGVYSSVARQMDFITQASGYEISATSTSTSSLYRQGGDSAGSVPVPAPTSTPAATTTNQSASSTVCSDRYGWIYYKDNKGKGKIHTCNDIKDMNNKKREEVCDCQQRLGTAPSGAKVAQACRATCGEC